MVKGLCLLLPLFLASAGYGKVNLLTGEFSTTFPIFEIKKPSFKIVAIYGKNFTKPGFLGKNWCSPLDFKLNTRKTPFQLDRCGQIFPAGKIEKLKKGWALFRENGYHLHFGRQGNLMAIEKGDVKLKVVKNSKTIELNGIGEKWTISLKNGRFQWIRKGATTMTSFKYSDQFLIEANPISKKAFRFDYENNLMSQIQMRSNTKNISYKNGLVQSIRDRYCFESYLYELEKKGQIIVSSQKKCGKDKVEKKSYLVIYDKKTKKIESFTEKQKRRSIHLNERRSISSIQTPRREVKYSYDKLHRIERVERTVGTTPYEAIVKYSKNGKVSQVNILFRNGEKKNVFLKYDQKGRLVTLEGKESPIKFYYNSNGKIELLQRNSKKLHFRYDRSSKLASLMYQDSNRKTSPFGIRSKQLNASGRFAIQAQLNAMKTLEPLYTDSKLFKGMVENVF